MFSTKPTLSTHLFGRVFVSTIIDPKILYKQKKKKKTENKIYKNKG
jgi:hypothetical protein